MPKIVVIPFTGFYQSPIGWLEIKNTATHICSIEFIDQPDTKGKVTNDLTTNCIEQLADYFNGKAQLFKLPLWQEGTAFQQQVWEWVTKIPYAQTRSYNDIASQMNDASLARAVGAANGRNKLAIVVPCHRVIASNGHLTGYAWGIDKKQWLIDHEAKTNGSYNKLF